MAMFDEHESEDRVGSGDYGFESPEGSDYSDAHYVERDKSTDPLRYYSPHIRAGKPSRKKKRGGGRAVGVIALCLVCAVLGGLAGAHISRNEAAGQLAEVNASLSALSDRLAEVESRRSETVVIAQAAEGSVYMSPAELYADACDEVVGITTPVTYTNFFGMTSSSAVSGSGVIISESGYILTNYHVIEYASEYGSGITVMLHDGERFEASIVGTEEYSDIAVLKIDASGLPCAKIGSSAALNVGDTVYAVGNPLGELEFSMSTGHVSALDRRIVTDSSGDAINMFQIDAAVNEGNSGGPVYNAVGEVVGIVTAKYSDKGVEGLGFAIPIDDANAIASELMTKGYVSGKADLGIECDERYNYIYSRWYNLPIGAYVKAVIPGSCAENAGLRAGDIITELDGLKIESDTELAKAVRRCHSGDTAELTFYRSGSFYTVSVVFDEAGAEAAGHI